TLKPFIDVARAQGKGIFTLVRTSNPQSDAIQNHPLADGRTVAQMVADEVSKLGQAQGMLGPSGYSLVGAVVGATKPADAADLRRRMPRQIFLVPGYGAQGGQADDVRACFNPDGQGALITASRSVLFAYEKTDTRDWTSPIAAAAEQMKREITAILA
ncbi:MAG: orotidine-5'-phosphate decarboxylase, partial [Phycisphaeraceae bacterium]|nr:orotidine-5'-phosphate decarboxylase [Phycisphaeraceae bacterium]